MFSGNSRFKLLRRLGAGSMGVVYEALDQQRNTRVALKTLREVDANLLYRLKREFRSLRDLSHRNLIGLDELFEENGHWFFTMELLGGEDLDAHFGRIAATTSTGNLVPRQTLGSDTLATMEARSASARRCRPGPGRWCRGPSRSTGRRCSTSIASARC
jgi:serine/threonine protein kinase